jgi:hypothetical protein
MVTLPFLRYHHHHPYRYRRKDMSVQSTLRSAFNSSSSIELSTFKPSSQAPSSSRVCVTQQPQPTPTIEPIHTRDFINPSVIRRALEQRYLPRDHPRPPYHPGEDISGNDTGPTYMGILEREQEFVWIIVQYVDGHEGRVEVWRVSKNFVVDPDPPGIRTWFRYRRARFAQIWESFVSATCCG